MMPDRPASNDDRDAGQQQPHLAQSRNPPALSRITLKSAVEPRVPQAVWYVDGEPFAATECMDFHRMPVGRSDASFAE
jgi:hypothetical protein